MADAAAARREARRRKILENSQNRLQIISGKSTCQASHGIPVYSDPEEVLEDLSSISKSSCPSVTSYNNGVIATDGESTSYSPLINHVDEAGDNELMSNFLAPLLPQLPLEAQDRAAERPSSPPFWEKLFANRYDVAILSVILQLLFRFYLVSFDEFYFFMPLAMYVMMKSIWFPSKPSSNFANILLLLNGLSTTRVQKLIQITQVVGSFSQDICIFLFTTICVQALHNAFT